MSQGRDACRRRGGAAVDNQIVWGLASTSITRVLQDHHPAVNRALR